MADQEPRDAATLGEMMRRRASASPDAQYFSLFDETVTYGRLWAQSARSSQVWVADVRYLPGLLEKKMMTLLF